MSLFFIVNGWILSGQTSYMLLDHVLSTKSERMGEYNGFLLFLFSVLYCPSPLWSAQKSRFAEFNQHQAFVSLLTYILSFTAHNNANFMCNVIFLFQVKKLIHKVSLSMPYC